MPLAGLILFKFKNCQLPCAKELLMCYGMLLLIGLNNLNGLHFFQLKASEKQTKARLTQGLDLIFASSTLRDEFGPWLDPDPAQIYQQVSPDKQSIVLLLWLLLESNVLFLVSDARKLLHFLCGSRNSDSLLFFSNNRLNLWCVRNELKQVKMILLISTTSLHWCPCTGRSVTELMECQAGGMLWQFSFMLRTLIQWCQTRFRVDL